MMAAGVSWEEVVDTYIPAAARRLGELWCIDEVSFVDVTVGTARLQSMLRDLGPVWSQETASDPLAPNVLLIVRQDAYHTLGAMVAAEQLRRSGVSVRLSLGASDDLVVEMVGSKRFDAVLISAASSERLESVRDLVKKVRMAMRPAAPIVVGGTMLDTDRDVEIITGADFVTSNPQEALRLCGLKTSAHGAQCFAIRM
jgi:methylmalonyl-CoA mutase cobalamin-binding subunit